MTRLLLLSPLGLAACGGLTPLGEWEDTDPGVLDTADDPGTDDIDPGTDPVVSGAAPNLVTLSAADLGSQVSVAFTATDSDGDLSGGVFELTVNGGTTAYGIPGSLSTWDGSSGAGTIRFAAPSTGGSTGCSGGTTNLSIQGVIEDAGGLRSGQKVTSVSVGSGGGGLPTTEVGDQLADVYDAGVLTVPCSLAGDIYQTGGGSGYYDLDVIAFAVSSSASNMNLSWSGSSDFDVYVFDSVGMIILELFEGDMTLAPPLASGINEGSAPENVAVALTPGEVYYALVGGWDGPAGAYTLRVQ